MASWGKGVKLDGGRLPLQKESVAIFGDPGTTQDIPVWIFLVDPGHFRVMSDADLRSVLDVEGLQSLDALTLETREERERLATFRLRLFRAAISPHKKQWRLTIPSEAFEACDEYLDRSQVWIPHDTSILDVYTAIYVQKIQETPPSRTFPRKEE